jgi:hypothetical protein
MVVSGRSLYLRFILAIVTQWLQGLSWRWWQGPTAATLRLYLMDLLTEKAM